MNTSVVADAQNIVQIRSAVRSAWTPKVRQQRRRRAEAKLRQLVCLVKLSAGPGSLAS